MHLRAENGINPYTTQIVVVWQKPREGTVQTPRNKIWKAGRWTHWAGIAWDSIYLLKQLRLGFPDLKSESNGTNGKQIIKHMQIK